MYVCIWYMHVYLALNISVYFHVNPPLHVHLEDRGCCQHDFIRHCPPYFLKQLLYWVWSLPFQLGLLASKFLGSLWLWAYNSFPPCLASYMNTRSLNSALFTCLHSRNLAIWVMSPAMPVSYADGNLVIRIGECFVLRMGVPSSPKDGPATSSSTLSAPLVLLVSGLRTNYM